MAPTDPKRLQVLDRFVTVLRAIVAGDLYFFKPAEVVKGSILLGIEAKGYPTYMVNAGSPGEDIEHFVDQQFEETFYPEVEGIAYSDKDIVGMIEKCIRDVRVAIETDAASGQPGTLGATSLTKIKGPPDIELGAMANQPTSIVGGFGWFTQRFSVRIEGYPGGV